MGGGFAKITRLTAHSHAFSLLDEANARIVPANRQPREQSATRRAAGFIPAVLVLRATGLVPVVFGEPPGLSRWCLAAGTSPAARLVQQRSSKPQVPPNTTALMASEEPVRFRSRRQQPPCFCAKLCLRSGQSQNQGGRPGMCPGLAEGAERSGRVGLCLVLSREGKADPLDQVSKV